MNLTQKTIKAHLKHFKLKMDKEKCIMNGKYMAFCNTIVKEKQDDLALAFLEGLSCGEYFKY